MLDASQVPVPDLDFDPDLAIITPVPDAEFDKDLEEPAAAEIQDQPEAIPSTLTHPAPRLTQCGPEFYRLADDSEDEGSSRCAGLAGEHPRRYRLSTKAASFVEWLRWRRPFLRFEGMSKGLGWEYPLAKCEKRELLLLVMLGEQDLQRGTHEDVRNVILTASAAQFEAGEKLESMAARSRPSFCQSVAGTVSSLGGA
eukprot:TRINITY_DN74376_c0_g1_i1.p1 TRINITY_DN74376_c0_g1~~TRINITY_DN74376_c0_g1_i1.p1  ORF type:complete len:198 (+),score=31.81 TRINITY_DN74376_c0_g1_i1:58-651(+)